MHLHLTIGKERNSGTDGVSSAVFLYLNYLICLEVCVTLKLYGEKIPHDNYYVITSLLFLTFPQFLRGLEFN